MTLCGNPLSLSLLGVKRTWLVAAHMSAFDPKRTFLLRELMSASDPKRTSAAGPFTARASNPRRFGHELALSSASRGAVACGGVSSSKLLLGSARLLGRSQARTQPARLSVGTTSPQPRTAPIFRALVGRLGELGYEEGKNFTFEFVQAPNVAGYSAAFRDLVGRGVDILVASGPEVALQGAIAAAGSRPIVMIAVDFDPFAHGYVKSLARPGGNITGVFFQQPALAAKRAQLLKDAFPALSGATVFWDQVSADQWQAMRQTAESAPAMHLSGIEFHERPFDYEKALE